MLLRVKDIVRMTGGRLIGDPDVLIDGAAPVDEAGPTDVAFVAERSYAAAAKSTEAGCVIVTDDLEGHIWGEDGTSSRPPAVIVAANARLSFAAVLETLKPLPLHPKGIHPTAVVADDVQFGADVAVGPHAVIESGAILGDGVVVGTGAFVGVGVNLGRQVVVGAASIVGEATRIGDNTVMHPRVTVMDRVTIGCRVILHSGCVIGADGFGYVSLADGHHKVPHIGTVVIEDDVEVGANSTIDRATTGETFIGRGTKIDNHVMIAHNVRLGEHCLVVAMTGISGGTTAGDRVIFAGKSGVVGHVHIGSGAIVAAAAIVAGDVPEGSHVSGFPARPHRQHMRVLAATQKLPEQLKEMAQLKKQVAELQRQLNEGAPKSGSGDDR